MKDIEVIHGDCRQVMARLGPVDAVVTDPPYGVGLGTTAGAGGKHGLIREAYSEYVDTYENFVAEIVPRINLAIGIAKRAAVFTGPHIHEQAKPDAIGGIYCSAGAGRHSWGFKTLLPILLYGKAPAIHLGAKSIVLPSNAAAEKNGHPCPKPLEWMIWLVQLVSLPGELILDPFGGSGTTAVACQKTGRRCVVIESDPRYIPIINRRVRDAATPLLDALIPA